MVIQEKTFAEHLSELRKYLAERKLLGDLATRADAKSRTVQYALTAKSTQDLKGKRLKVFEQAILMRKELDILFVDFVSSDTTKIDGTE